MKTNGSNVFFFISGVVFAIVIIFTISKDKKQVETIEFKDAFETEYDTINILDALNGESLVVDTLRVNVIVTNSRVIK